MRNFESIPINLKEEENKDEKTPIEDSFGTIKIKEEEPDAEQTQNDAEQTRKDTKETINVLDKKRREIEEKLEEYERSDIRTFEDREEIAYLEEELAELDLKKEKKDLKEEDKRESFLNALDEKLIEMQESGRISPEEAEEKRKSASLIETNFSDDLKHDAELFALSGIAGEEEIIDIFEKKSPDDIRMDKKELKKPITGDMATMVDDINRYNESIKANEVDKSSESLEKTPENIEEKLNTKREDLAKEYSKLKEKTLGIFGGKSSERVKDEENAQRIAEIENEYRNVLKDYRIDLFEKNKDNSKEAEQILLQTIVGEATKFSDLKTQIRMEEMGKTKTEKLVKSVAKIGNWYKKQPLKVKLAVSGALIAGGLASGLAGGVTGTALVSGLFVGKLTQRIFGGAATAVGLDGFLQKSQQKGEGREVLKEFDAGKLSELLKTDSAKLDKKLFELEGSQKRKLVRRVAMSGTAGVLMGSGAVAKAFGNVGGWLFGGNDIDVPQEKPSIEVPKEGIPEGSLVEPVGTPDYSSEILEVPEISETITVKSGDSIWKISENWLEENGKLEGLNEEQKTYVIDSLKDKLSEGIEKPDLIKAGQELDFGSKFDASDIEDAINKTKGLSVEQIENIKGYDAIGVEGVNPAENVGESIESVESVSDSVEQVAKETDFVSEDLQQIFTPEASVESMTENVKDLFGVDAVGEGFDVVTREDGVNVIKNIYGHKGFDLLLSEDKIGIEGPASYNWGSKGSLLGLGNRIPTENLSKDSITSIKKVIEESAKQIKESMPDDLD